MFYQQALQNIKFILMTSKSLAVKSCPVSRQRSRMLLERGLLRAFPVLGDNPLCSKILVLRCLIVWPMYIALQLEHLNLSFPLLTTSKLFASYGSFEYYIQVDSQTRTVVQVQGFDPFSTEIRFIYKFRCTSCKKSVSTV